MGLKFSIFPAISLTNKHPALMQRSNLSARFITTQASPVFPKIDINGENAIPLYRRLYENTTFEGFGLVLTGIVKKMDKDYKKNGKTKWNFNKFLIGRDGEILARFEPMDMKHLKEKIKEAL